MKSFSVTASYVIKHARIIKQSLGPFNVVELLIISNDFYQQTVFAQLSN